MAIYNCYEAILQGEEATEENALAFAMGFCFEEEPQEQSIGYADYIDTVNGVGIYYDYAADYYFFTHEANQ